MRRISLWLLSTLSVLVLLFSYRTSTMGTGGQAAEAQPAAAPRAAATGGPAGDGGTGTSGSGGRSPSAAAGTSTKDGTYPGSLTQTRWGPIQVAITVAGGKITDVAVPTYPHDNRRDQQINSYALPALRQATLTAQSAQIDTVSGATVTSDGYKQSLQAAIDAAHRS